MRPLCLSLFALCPITPGPFKPLFPFKNEYFAIFSLIHALYLILAYFISDSIIASFASRRFKGCHLEVSSTTYSSIDLLFVTVTLYVQLPLQSVEVSTVHLKVCHILNKETVLYYNIIVKSFVSPKASNLVSRLLNLY